ncbi:hypothetical protein LEMA_P042140.1 [Plenodomus lingam JN3]|uniref:alcohol dehydrogenase (NADP(+)) n=1 Tax=Leptosphaeria maculans (strain JN3 / isolate v23.1.3 / race Av1-4-5-6-7-8) TaxID=985895 RepID=E4ZNU4_LEPMJ|nr:hypothetical protein LEMA_P042140.1 [Plenodomus lingam JN3]CBX93313.1 hypothetical protein LEMA_P042140.1 [Plenodomus lingam JN3]
MPVYCIVSCTVPTPRERRERVSEQRHIQLWRLKGLDINFNSLRGFAALAPWHLQCPSSTQNLGFGVHRTMETSIDAVNVAVVDAKLMSRSIFSYGAHLRLPVTGHSRYGNDLAKFSFRKKSHIVNYLQFLNPAITNLAMPYPETTDAFAVNDTKNWSTFKRQELPLKKFEETDVDIAIDACGVCASDVHTITGGWGDDIPLPLCVGHEVIGKVVRVGSKVTRVKVGDRAGIGAQIGADLTCGNCKADQENYCENQIDTYGAKHTDGTVAQGGYSSHIRGNEYFVFKIPDNLDTALAAPMLCAGLTTYSPLKRLGAGPGKKVAIVGLGGLGHFGVLWSVALGAETYVISHSASKKNDAMKMGAKDFIVTNEKGWNEKHKFKFDFIINTADATDKFDLSAYFSTLKVGGTFHMVGFPDNPLPAMQAQIFAPNGCYMGASHIGNRPEMEEMFELASKQNIKSWVQEIPLSEAGIKEAVERVYKNDNVRYRITLTKFDDVFGKRA